MPAVVVVALVAVVVAYARGTEPVEGNTLSAVVLDKSPSSVHMSDDVRRRAVDGAVDGALTQGGYLLVDRIGSTGSSLVWSGSIDCPSGNPARCDDHRATVGTEIRRAATGLLNAPNDEATDLLATLRAIETYRSGLDRPVDQVRVTAITDGVQTEVVDLLSAPLTDEVVAKLVKQAEAARAVPEDCTGWTLDMYGVVQAGNGVSPAFVAGVREFWTQILQSCGGRLGVFSPDYVQG